MSGLDSLRDSIEAKKPYFQFLPRPIFGYGNFRTPGSFSVIQAEVKFNTGQLVSDIVTHINITTIYLADNNLFIYWHILGY